MPGFTDKAQFKLGYLSHFYMNALETYITAVYLEPKKGY